MLHTAYEKVFRTIELRQLYENSLDNTTAHGITKAFVDKDSTQLGRYYYYPRLIKALNKDLDFYEESIIYQKKKFFRHTKSMSYPRLIKALNKDLAFYEESLDNIYPRLMKSF